MWSVNTRPNCKVSSAGGCLGCAVRVIAISVTVLLSANAVGNDPAI